MAMTYNSLVQNITDYLNTTNATTLDNIPNFIYLTHQEICRKYENLGYEQYVNGNFIANAQNGGAVIAKPARWRRNISFTCGTDLTGNTINILQLRDYEYVRDYAPNTTLGGLPLFYSDYGFNNWLIAPIPNLSYPFQIAYLEMPVPINVNNQTNWLTNYAPDALLWGSLTKAIPFLKDDERAPLWKSYYEEAMNTLNYQDKKSFNDRISKRDSD